MRRLLVPVLLLPLLGGVARAEIALLANGQTLKLDGHRLESGQLVLRLRGGGELELPAALVQGFVADEVVEEIVRESASGRELRALAADVAQRHGLPPELVTALVSVESGFRAEAVSPKGAQGLMQLMPTTARSLGVEDAFDPEQNLDGGVRHLGALLTLYGGDLTRALAAYNAGQGAVAKYGGVPPYAETQAYVKKVLERYAPAPPVRKAPRRAKRAAARVPAEEQAAAAHAEAGDRAGSAK